MKDTDLTKMSDLQLAEYKQGHREDHPRVVLVEREFVRRDRMAQQKLNIKLMIVAALIGIIGTLLGAIVQSKLQSYQKENSSQTTKYQTERKVSTPPLSHEKKLNGESSPASEPPLKK